MSRMKSQQKNNGNPNSWINNTLASFVPQTKEKGGLEDGEVYLVIEEIVKQKNAQKGLVK